MVFEEGKTIRLIATGKPYLVLLSSKIMAWVIDLGENSIFVQPLVVLERSFDKFEEDWKMDRKDIKHELNGEEQFKWEQSTL